MVYDQRVNVTMYIYHNGCPTGNGFGDRFRLPYLMAPIYLTDIGAGSPANFTA